jgi:hypothetical protein
MVPITEWLSAPRLGAEAVLRQVEKHLDKQAANLFANAFANPKSDLTRIFLQDNLLADQSYLYTSCDPTYAKIVNAEPDWTKAAIEHHFPLPFPHAIPLFSNPLSYEFGKPSKQRAFNNGYCVYTMEFDKLPLAGQCAIITDGRLAAFHDTLIGFRDYRGHEIVFSAGKSLHFHFVFDLTHMKHGLSTVRDRCQVELPDEVLRTAYKLVWTRLRDLFCAGCAVASEPDPTLNQYERMRRFPWGLRRIMELGPLGFPLQHMVPQVVLASDVYKKQKSRGEVQWFHDVEDLIYDIREQPVEPVKRSRKFQVPTHERSIIDKTFPQIFNTMVSHLGMRYSHYDFCAEGIAVYFHNSPDDEVPSSVCVGDHTRILIQSRDPDLLRKLQGSSAGTPLHIDGVFLEKSPNEIFTIEVGSAQSMLQHDFESNVYDQDSLSQFLDRTIDELVVRKSRRKVVIVGPQGCGKSTRAMKKIPQISRNDPGRIMFSSLSREQAIEKLAAFRAICNDAEGFASYEGFLYLSLTALYEQFCPVGERITSVEVYEDGGSSWLHTIFAQQPVYFGMMMDYRDTLMAIYAKGKTPVFFGCHETVRQHVREGAMTRVFYAPGFSEKWFHLPRDAKLAYKRRLLDENEIHHVILDECELGDVLAIHPLALVEWAADFVGWVTYGGRNAAPFFDLDIGERYRKYIEYFTISPIPDMTWERFQDIYDLFHAHFLEENLEKFLYSVSGAEVFLDDTRLYGARIGDRYAIRERGWWNHYPRVTVLTTERCIAAVFQSINETAIANQAAAAEIDDCVEWPVLFGGHHTDEVDRFDVIEFSLPPYCRDLYAVETQHACKKQTLPQCVSAYSDRYPPYQIISNLVKQALPDLGVATHKRARGSNAYCDEDVLSFYNALSPDEFALLGALNSKLKRDDMVKLHYVDLVEQSVGRNRGFRGGNKRDHIAVFPYRLYRWIKTALNERANYVGYRRKASVVINIPRSPTKKVVEIISDDELYELDESELGGVA